MLKNGQKAVGSIKGHECRYLFETVSAEILQLPVVGLKKIVISSWKAKVAKNVYVWEILIAQIVGNYLPNEVYILRHIVKLRQNMPKT